MKIAVLYDSQFGNTKKVAEAIAEALQTTELLHIQSASAEKIAGVDLLVVGCPTQKFNALPSVTGFLKSLPAGFLKGKKVAAFDTRASLANIKSRFFRFIVKTGGFAAPKLERLLKEKGGAPVQAAGGFEVLDTEGPLLEGELLRAREWAAGMLAKLPEARLAV